jgi:hypothetical protein
MSLRQLRTRIERLERLEAKSLKPVNAARARLEELRLRRWKHANRPNEGEKPLTEEEEAEFDELFYRFHPLGSFLKALDEAEQRAREDPRRRRPE